MEDSQIKEMVEILFGENSAASDDKKKGDDYFNFASHCTHTTTEEDEDLGCIFCTRCGLVTGQIFKQGGGSYSYFRKTSKKE